MYPSGDRWYKTPRSSPSRVQRQQASSRCIHKLVAPSPLPIRSPVSEISASLIKERHHHQPAGPRYNTTLAHPIRLVLCNSPPPAIHDALASPSTKHTTAPEYTSTMAAVMSHYAPQQNMHYGYVPPPSPPLDDTKCSLPSISNLLGLADQGSPTSETHPQIPQRRFLQAVHPRPFFSRLTDPSAQSIKSETRPNSSHYGNPALMRNALPPSPPMSSDASFEGYNSPSTRSVSQLSTASNYYFEATPPLSHLDERHMAMPRVQQVQPVHTSAYQPQYAAPAYMNQPAMASYYPPMQPTPPPQQMQGMYYQRPLPQVCCSPELACPEPVADRIPGLPSHARVDAPWPQRRRQPLAAPPLHRSLGGGVVSPVPGPLHLPDVQQGVLAAQLAPDPQPLAHGREALQVPAPRVRQGL